MELKLPEVEAKKKPEKKQGTEKSKTEIEQQPQEFKSPLLGTLGGVSKGPSKIVEDGREVTVKEKVSEKPNDQDVYLSLDGRDEAQVVSQLTGGYIEEFVYEYCKRHKWEKGIRPQECNCTDTIRDLSWLGIQEASRSMKITVQDGTTWLWFDSEGKLSSENSDGTKNPGLTVHEFPDSIRVIVKAFDPHDKMVRIGVATQPKATRRYGKTVPDEFYLQKALSKAERNALRQLLPQTAMKMWIDKFLMARNASESKKIETTPNNIPITKQSLEKLMTIIQSQKIEVTHSYVENLVKSESRAKYALDQIDAGGLDQFLKWITPIQIGESEAE